MRIMVTGANGQLGRLVLGELIRIEGIEVIAGVRRPASISDLPSQKIQVRNVDYDHTESLASALQGVDRLLLVSSSEVGQRTTQHRNVIEAARTAQVKLIAYTSVLHAPTNRMLLAQEHRETEELLHQSGVPYVLLRNGWYTENYLASLPQALAMGQIFGCASNGKLSLASRADYAAAAAKAVTGIDQAGKVYELAGDTAYTMNDIAAEMTRQIGKPVQYVDLTEADYIVALKAVGLPEGFAKALADSDAQAAKGALHEDSNQLSQLIGRPTTSLQDSVRTALQRAHSTNALR